MAIAWPLSAGDLGSSGAVSVTVSPTVSREPAQITVRVLIEPNPDHRSLEVVAESASFFRRSYVQLEGDRAARSQVFQYHGLPAGDYAVRVVVRDGDGDPEGLAVAKVLIGP